MKVSLVSLFLLAFVASVQSVRITNCNSRAAIDLNRIQITGCAGQRRACIFKKGQSAKMSIPFTPRYPVNSLTAVVYGIIGPIPVPFPLPNSDGCFKSGLICPLQPNVPVEYTASLPVRKEYPSILVTVRWQLKDDQGNDLVCISFPVRLQ